MMRDAMPVLFVFAVAAGVGAVESERRLGAPSSGSAARRRSSAAAKPSGSGRKSQSASKGASAAAAPEAKPDSAPSRRREPLIKGTSVD
ncbi:MAG: hypothetical protein LBT92_00810 [Rickettsiales bacterium]|jgi:hypothetical protein|nr:hypothetical protein [Rickettsiales bacterium]